MHKKLTIYDQQLMQADKDLIQRFISWAIKRELTQTQMATLANRTKGWASLIVRGKIKILKFETRNRIKNLLGETDASDAERDGRNA
jgi:hypothetical protein